MRKFLKNLKHELGRHNQLLKTGKNSALKWIEPERQLMINEVLVINKTNIVVHYYLYTGA